MKRDQASQNNNINVSDGITIYENSLNNSDHDDNNYNDIGDDYSDDTLIEVVLRNQSICYILRALGLHGSDKRFGGSAQDNYVYHMMVSMIIVVNMSVRIIKYYFKTKSSEELNNIDFWKESNLFDDEGYQGASDGLKKKPLDRG